MKKTYECPDCHTVHEHKADLTFCLQVHKEQASYAYLAQKIAHRLFCDRLQAFRVYKGESFIDAFNLMLTEVFKDAQKLKGE